MPGPESEGEERSEGFEGRGEAGDWNPGEVRPKFPLSCDLFAVFEASQRPKGGLLPRIQ